MNTLFQLDIPRKTQHCSLKGERLLPGMEIYSLILEENSKNLIRKDFCLACWAQFQKENEATFEVYWKSKIEGRKPCLKSSKRNMALNLLKELKQTADANEAEIFVLCLFLSHARQIALRKEFHEEGLSYHLYEILGEEEYLTVKALNLSSDQIIPIQQFLANRLKA